MTFPVSVPGNGTDCDDSDCDAVHLCILEDCNNGVDDDGDGAVDCADTDCAGDPACGPPSAGDECVDAIAAVLGSNAVDTTGATDSTDLSDPSQCSGTFLGQFVQDILQRNLLYKIHHYELWQLNL